MAVHRITITRSAQQVTTTPASSQNFTLSYSFKMTASDGVNTPNEIFKLNRRPLDPNAPAGAPQDLYQGVCAPYDLTNLSINAPAEGMTQFRVAEVTLTFANQLDADTAWVGIKEDAQALMDALEAADNLNNREVFVTA